jgi:glycosyltransferase involved in cell wall biosynthesis
MFLSRRKKPKLSVIVIFFNMEREAKRTLYSLTTKYQIGIQDSDYEVLAVDCGSDNPLQESMVKSFGTQFSLLRMPSNPSPAASINLAVSKAKGDLIMVCIDGARILSPGILSLTMTSFKAFENPVVATLSMHLGPDVQSFSMLKGYNREKEDELLTQSCWEDNGMPYLIFPPSQDRARKVGLYR